MRISNIANNKADKVYELEVIGTLQEVEDFASFTSYTADFIEEDLNGKYSLTIMGSNEGSKKEFRGFVTEELKKFRNFKTDERELKWRNKVKNIIKEIGYKEGDKIVKLVSLDKYPLSTQLMAISGDSYNTNDFYNLHDRTKLTANSGNKIVHKTTRVIYVIPKKKPAKKKATTKPANKKTEYNVFNYTDNVYASSEVFKTKKQANDFIKKFRNRFKKQGYYKTNQWEKINPEHIDLEIIQDNFNPLKKDNDIIETIVYDINNFFDKL